MPRAHCQLVRSRIGNGPLRTRAARRRGAHDELGHDRAAVVGRGAAAAPPSSSATQRRPSSAKSCRTVVSGGQKCAASGMSSKPTIADVARDVEAVVADGVHEPERHLVVRGEDRGEVAHAEQLPPGVVAELRGPVAEDRRGGRHVAARSSRRGSRASGPRPRSSPAVRRGGRSAVSRGRSGVASPVRAPAIWSTESAWSAVERRSTAG